MQLLLRTYLWCCIILLSSIRNGYCFKNIIRATKRMPAMPPILCVNSADSEMNWDPKSGPKLDFNEDYYSVLDVDSKVDAKELKKAYYKLVFKYHPDNIENESSKSLCNKQMMVINGAYRILKNIDLRGLYDIQRRKGLTGLAAGIKESSTSTKAATSAAPERPPATKQAPPKPVDNNGSKGKKYSGSGFGGSWGDSGNTDDFESESEQEYLDQERERERQRQRYQEPQPQTQRQRDQQTRDKDREFDFSYKQDGVFETPNRTPWGFNTNTYDEPVRPNGRYTDDLRDIDNVEDFLRRRGSGVSDMFSSTVKGQKAKLEALCARKVMKEREMDRISAGVKDWGEVTDVRMIRKRIEDINEIKSLTTEIADLADDIADGMLRSASPPSMDSNDGYRSQGNVRRDTSTKFTTPVDLWGDTPTRPPPRTAVRPPVKSVTPPRPAAGRSPRPGSIDWDAGRNAKGADTFEYDFDEETMDRFGETENAEDTESAWRMSRRNPTSSKGSNGQAFASFLFEDDVTGDDEDEAEEVEGDDAKSSNAVLNELLRIFKEKNKRKK